mmetsp:Transcript_33031/g.87302  ORF Transcript_33031/g.87302 Transcript_33031/m.87302 type:complete len:290 (-) Transcript_33031:36-905(-)
MVGAHHVHRRVRMVRLRDLPHGAKELWVRLSADQHVDLLEGRHAPGPDDVDADKDAANGIHPPEITVDPRQRREGQSRRVRQDVVEVVQSQGFQRDVVGLVVLRFGHAPDHNLHAHDDGQHVRRRVGEVHVGPSRPRRDERLDRVVDHRAGGQGHEHGADDNAHRLQAGHSGRERLLGTVGLCQGVCTEQHPLRDEVDRGVHQRGQHRQRGRADDRVHAEAPPRQGHPQGDLDDVPRRPVNLAIAPTSRRTITRDHERARQQSLRAHRLASKKYLLTVCISQGAWRRTC